MRLFIDCTDTYYSGKNTGIQRVVRNFVKHAVAIGSDSGIRCFPIVFHHASMHVLEDPAELSRLSPRESSRVRLNGVYLKAFGWVASLLPFPGWKRFFLAHRKEFGLAQLMYLPFEVVARVRKRFNVLDEHLDGMEQHINEGDVVFLPDSSWSGDAFVALSNIKSQGGLVVFFLHDIIPLTHPEFFEPNHVARFREWFNQVIGVADGIVCNSRFTEKSMNEYLSHHTTQPGFASDVVYLGYDLGVPPKGSISHAKLGRALLSSPKVFVFVGTIEPRKNLDTLIDAFEILWDKSREQSLVLIGRRGWLCDALVNRIRRHPQWKKNLYWFDDVSDEDLALVYQQASALIQPSFVEGFGLPLIEAMSSGLPVIASDIPVFREVIGENGQYFERDNAEHLASGLRKHMSNPWSEGRSSFHWVTWRESTEKLLIVLRALAEAKEE